MAVERFSLYQVKNEKKKKQALIQWFELSSLNVLALEAG